MQTERKQELKAALAQLVYGVGMLVAGLAIVGVLGYSIYALFGGLSN